MLHLGPIWYHSEPSDVPYSQNLPRPISWFGLFLEQNNPNLISTAYYIATWTLKHQSAVYKMLT